MGKIRTMYKLAGILALGMKVVNNPIGGMAALSLPFMYVDYKTKMYDATSGLSPEEAGKKSLIRKLTRQPKRPGEDPAIRTLNV